MTDRNRGGFRAMTPEKRREIFAKGGASVPPEKRSFSQNRTLAQQAGQKGGKATPAESRTFYTNRELAREAGRKGGKAARKEPKMKLPDSGKPPPPPPPPPVDDESECTN